MSDKTPLYSLSINAIATLNLHDLNNEGGEGNQTITRFVTIVDKEGNLASVNAISGDMMKHIQAEHLWHQVLEKNLPLCSQCRMFNPNRISGDEEYLEEIGGPSKTKDKEAIDKLLETCALDDLEGVLITAKNRNTPRKSVVEFGWVVGLPGRSHSENYLHTKLVPDARREASREEGEEEGDAEGINVGQNIFHRPANSGQYAIVLNLETCRIGFNDISKTYPLNLKERQNRFSALMKSVMFSLTNPQGAQRNTQNPHITKLEGVISLSTKPVPAPTVSPLESDYVGHIKETTEQLNSIENNAIKNEEFSDLPSFIKIMTDVIKNYSPYTIKAVDNG